MIVDEMHEEHPELLKDQFWDDVVPKDLPYTVASEHYRREEPKGSADSYKIKAHDAMYANIVTPKKSLLGEDMYADYVSRNKPFIYKQFCKSFFRSYGLVNKSVCCVAKATFYVVVIAVSIITLAIL